MERFCISLAEIFCKTIAFALINKYDKGGVVQIWTMFSRIYHVAFRLYPLKQYFLGIDLAMFLGVPNLGNISAMRVIFFLKILQISNRFQKWIKKLRKKFLFSRYLHLNSLRLNCLHPEENTCHRHWVCYENVFRFCISLTDPFCEAIAFGVINKDGKGRVLQFWTMF